MNYDKHPDFNKARTAREETQAFAAQRVRTYRAANEDFNVGMKYGIALIPGAIALLWWAVS